MKQFFPILFLLILVILSEVRATVNLLIADAPATILLTDVSASTGIVNTHLELTIFDHQN